MQFNQSQWLKQYVELNTQKRIEAKENSDKDRNALYKSMINVVYAKSMEEFRNIINGGNKKDLLKWLSHQPMCHAKFLTIFCRNTQNSKLHKRLTIVHLLECVFWN